mmetsp:Transcript_14686/g.30125  ORF Transcript_14686/g.30125 Transcript_14686/m.30125 type:complete len:89 (-) Transcript_14686:28-294(-)
MSKINKGSLKAGFNEENYSTKNKSWINVLIKKCSVYLRPLKRSQETLKGPLKTHRRVGLLVVIKIHKNQAESGPSLGLAIGVAAHAKI